MAHKVLAVTVYKEDGHIHVEIGDTMDTSTNTSFCDNSCESRDEFVNLIGNDIVEYAEELEDI